MPAMTASNSQRFLRCLASAALLLGVLSGCDQLGIETPAQVEQRRVAESKAMGGACRQAGRALEDCYQINPKGVKAAIFDGWREMDAYMRENKLEEVKPQFPMTPPPPKAKKPLEGEAAAEGEAKADGAKAAAKH
jgi:hypothetical protein